MYVASGITKHFGGVSALDRVDLTIRPGEVHALLGANGAGKSTLVKILVGAEQPSSGTLSLDGRQLQLRSVAEAIGQGISIVSQELNLFPDLTVVQNLFMQREPQQSRLFVDRRRMTRQARPVMAMLGLDVAPHRPVGSLRLADQQLVEIARSLLMNPKILFLDEPTSALQAADSQRLLDVVRRLRDTGVAVVYVSHFLEDVFAISDTVTVLRNGRVAVHRRAAADMSIPETVGEMLGDAVARAPAVIAQEGPASGPPSRAGHAPLQLRGVAVERLLRPLDLTVQPGEIVGLAGLEGSGASTVMEVIFGLRRATAGSVVLPDGRPGPRSMAAAVRAGIALVPADRKLLGLMLDKSVYENVSIVSGGPLRRMGVFLGRSRMRSRAERWRRQLGMVMPSTAAPAAQLSGGNQQKVVFAKWLETDPAVVLLDDPTRGVDVGARAEMHAIIRQMGASGRIVLLTSSDLDELASVCSRVVVLFQGAAVTELSGGRLTEHQLLEAINADSVNAAPVPG